MWSLVPCWKWSPKRQPWSRRILILALLAAVSGLAADFLSKTESIMDSLEFESRLHELKARAHGRWTEILRTLGVDQKVLNKRNQPCPACGGTDRFQYTDKFGNGDYICRGCGHGDGFKLLMQCKGWEFGTALRRVEELVGSGATLPRAKERKPSEEYMKKVASQT